MSSAVAPMFIAAVAGIVAFLMHRSDDAFHVHDSQRGWSDITKKRRAWSWPVRFFAVVWLIAFGIGLCAVAHADERPPPPSTYTLELWSTLNGFAIARTVGPITPAECTRTMAQINGHKLEMPPNMRRLIGQCVPKPTMVAQLAGWNCIASGHKSVPKNPDAVIWTYGCAAP